MERNNPYLLIAEDDEKLSGMIQRAFQAHPLKMEITWVDSLEAARNKLAQRQPDLLIIDSELTDGGGKEILQNAMNFTFPLVFLVGPGSEDCAPGKTRDGLLHYVEKREDALSLLPLIVHCALLRCDHAIRLNRAELLVREMERTIFSLQKVQSHESVRTYVGGIAHDFNNLLGVILGNISLAKLEFERGDRVFEYLEDAEKASARANELTRQLLAFSKLGAAIKKGTSIVPVIKDSVGFALRGSRMRCDFQFPDDLWPVEIDVGQISQALFNLTRHVAEKAIGEAGVISFRAENVELEGSEKLAISPGKYVRISMGDQQVLSPEQDLSQRLSPTELSGESDGYGLSLNTACAILRNHQGTVAVQSNSGAGSVFEVYLPASEKMRRERRAYVGRLPAGHGKILLMEDEEIVRNIADQMLERLGYKVGYARDGGEAIEMYERAMRSDEPFGAVMIDLTISGGMGGKETIVGLRKIDPAVKAIVTSGYPNDPVMADCEAYGFKGSVAKPYKLRELAEVVHRVITGADGQAE